MLWDMSARVLGLGVDDILDFEFWAKKEREDYRALAMQLGAGIEIHFLNVPGAVLLVRAAISNAHLSQGEEYIPEAKLNARIGFLHLPTISEMDRRKCDENSNLPGRRNRVGRVRPFAWHI
jgi:predicted kinase